MFIRVTRGKIDPSKYDELMRFSAEVAQAVAQQPGAQQQHLGGDATTGTTIAVSTWDTEEHARFPRESMAGVVGKAQAIGLSLDPPEIYESFT